MIFNRRNLMVGTAAATVMAGLPVWAQSEDVMSLDAVLRDKDAPVLGNPNGDVTIVDYFDYQCPYCKSNHPEVRDFVAKDGNIRLVLKDWPIFGAPSVYAAHLTLGAASINLKDYETAVEALMATKSRLSNDQINDTLRKAGLDPAKLETSYSANRKKWDALINRNSTQASIFQFPGTPAYVIGTGVYPGVIDTKTLKSAVAEARKS